MRNVDEIRDIIAEIKSFLITKFTDGIKQVILYGSFARGEATDDSDIDVAVIVDDELNNDKIETSLEDLLLTILLEKKELVSVIIIPESRFNNYKSPFILNTRKEGVVI